MYYFKFEIPAGIRYSQGWHGTMPKACKNVTVLIYNDREGWGLARTDDTFVPPEVVVTSPADADKLLSEIKDEPKVYSGTKLTARKWAVADLTPAEIVSGMSVEVLDG